MASPDSLPTLLSSRPRHAEEAKPRRRAPPPALEQLGLEVPEVRVRNTFIEVPLSPPASAPHHRVALHTCPSAHVGRFSSEAMYDTAEAARSPSPYSEQHGEPLGAAPGDEPAPSRLVVSLSCALGGEPQQPPPWDAAALPSLGSAGHADGSCRPCAFVHAGRCSNGQACSFCHLCGPEERKRRRREKLDLRRAARAADRSRGGATRGGAAHR